MRKIGKESTAPAEKGADREKGGNGWLRSHWCALALGVIVIVAFLLRFVFAYGVSADGDFALSGGSGAQYHLYVVESILNGTYSFTDASVNYPVGGVLYIPPLLDFIAAGVAAVLGGAESASLSLAVIAPVIGALTCVPVYLVGREMYDKTIGVVAALVFAFLALPICTTVFSNGNEYGLAAFLVAFMTYFVVKMTKAVDADEPSRRGVLVNAVAAGVFLALAALTWNGFRTIVVLLALAMVIQAVLSRIRGKDFTDVTVGYSVVILLGTLIAAAYYIPAGLWDQVYSGPFLVAIVSVVFALAFVALREKLWVVTIPALIIAFIVVCVALALAVPDLFDDFFFGNSIYTSSIMDELASTRVSLSEAASYYGWLTLWIPICVVFYEVYRYFRKEHTSTKLFTIVWMFMMFISIWSSYATSSVVGGIVTAVGAAAGMTMIVREAKLRDWASNIRAAGFPGCFRKLIKPLPFCSVLVVALLVVLPNVSFAVDAGQPTNTEDDGAYYYGNTSYTIKTGDSYPVSEIWETYEDMPKSGAIVTWIDYSYDAVTQGGFSSVTDTLGGGSSAAAQIYMAEGSAGATAAMILRLMMSDTSVNYSNCFSDASVYGTIKGYIDDPSVAIEYIQSDPETFGNVRSDITDENAVYLAGIECIVTSMSLDEIIGTYDMVCSASGDKISYVLVDGSMLPLYYGDGDSFSTIAYFAGYSVDGYGAATEYYSYNTYYGYTTYTSEIYDTFLWRALIGLSATDAGYSSSYSYLSALSSSDGSVIAVPGYGLTGYTVVQWLVYYNADSDADGSSDGWEYIDGWEAIELQRSQGGVINYLAAIVLLEYTGVDSSTTVESGTVTMGGQAAEGVTVEVYQYSDVYGMDVLYSEAVVGSDGTFSILVPEGDYSVQIRSGDLILYTYDSVPSSVEIDAATVEGTVTVGDEIYSGESMMLTIVSDTTSESTSFEIEDGTFTIKGVLPGTYSYTLYGEDGTSLGTGTVSVYPGESVGLTVSPTSRTITVTVNDVHGNAIDGTAYAETPIVVATNTSTGVQFSAEVGDDGKAVIYVISGTYTLSMGQGFTTVTSTTQSASSSNRTASITAYESETVEVSGAPSGIVLTVSAGTFTTTSYTDGDTVKFDIPVGLATDEVRYSVYGFSGGKIYCGVYTGGGSVTLTGSDYAVVSGVLSDSDEDADEGTVTFVYASGFQMTYATDSEGAYTAIVPEGSCTVYATNSSDMVYLGAADIDGDTEIDITMVDGRKVTCYFRYSTSTSSGNENLPFVLASIEFTYNDTEYALYTMTNTSGVAYFYIPDSTAATVYFNGGTLDNDYFYCEDITKSVSSGTSSTSNTTTIRYYGYEDDQENYVKQVSYTAEVDMTIVFYSDDEMTYDLEAGETYTLCPGQYEVTVDGDTGYYYDGTAYLYIGTTVFADLDYIEVAIVTVESGESDTVSIDTEDGTYHSFTGGYYLEVGHVYYFTSTCTEDDETLIAYGWADLTDAAAGAELTVDVTASAAQMTVTGSVGIVADGTITVTTGGFTHVFDVDDGAFTLVLPSDVTAAEVTAEVTTTSGDYTYTFTGTATFSDMADGSIRNVSVLLSDVEEDEDEDPDFEVTLDSAYFDDGTAVVVISITNNGDSQMTYTVTAGDAWTLDSACSVSVAAGATSVVSVTGTYDASTVAPGLDGVSVTVTDINGDYTVTKDITENSSSTTGGTGISVLVAGDDGASNDAISPSQYKYALTFVNGDPDSKTVRMTFTVPDGWYAVVMDADGTYIGESGEDITIYGLQTVTYYVSLMKIASEPGDEDEVPELKVTVSGDVSKSLDLKPTSVDISTDSTSVSGGDSLTERSGVPAGIWFLVAVMILMIIAIFWLASKRGMLSRR